jgi:hypothetical protein
MRVGEPDAFGRMEVGIDAAPIPEEPRRGLKGRRRHAPRAWECR